MSGRRKRAAPVKLNDGAKKQLSWNMHEDRRNDVTLDEDGGPPEPSTSLSLINDSPENLLTKYEIEGSNIQPLGKENKDSRDILAPLSVDLNLIILPIPGEDTWRALLCVFSLRVSSGNYTSSDFRGCSFTLTSTSSSKTAQLLLCALESDVDEVSKQESSKLRIEEVLVETSLGGEILEDIMWLQKKKLIALYQRTAQHNEFEVTKSLSLLSANGISDGHVLVSPEIQ